MNLKKNPHEIVCKLKELNHIISEPSLKEYIIVCYQYSAVSQLSIETQPNTRLPKTLTNSNQTPQNFCQPCKTTEYHTGLGIG